MKECSSANYILIRYNASLIITDAMANQAALGFRRGWSVCELMTSPSSFILVGISDGKILIKIS